MIFVEIKPRAVRDLKDIGGYIARDNPERAISYVRELRAKMEKIAKNPKGYPIRTDLEFSIRSASYQSYIIFFHILENGVVEIVRVIHGARDIDNLLG